MAAVALPAVCALWCLPTDATEPGLIGIPFVYWHHLLFVALPAILTGIVYLAEL